MGVSTVAIGALPTYQSIGLAAPALLALCRFGQGLGLGGEWGGAVLLAIENAPPGKRARYGMFPQLGAPLGLFLSTVVFLGLSGSLNNDQFFSFGWRIPFLASAVLVLVGLYVRLTIAETPVFAASVERHERVKVPMLVVSGTIPAGRRRDAGVAGDVRHVLPDDRLHPRLGHQRARVHARGLSPHPAGRRGLLALTIPISAALAERGRRRVLFVAPRAIAVFGLVMGPLFLAGTAGAVRTLAIGWV